MKLGSSKEEIIRAGMQVLQRSKHKDTLDALLREGDRSKATNIELLRKLSSQERSKMVSDNLKDYYIINKSLSPYVKTKLSSSKSDTCIDRYSRTFKDQRRNALWEEDICEREGLLYVLNKYAVDCYLNNIF